MSRPAFSMDTGYETLDERGLAVAHASRRMEEAPALGITSFEAAVYIASRGLTREGGGDGIQ